MDVAQSTVIRCGWVHDHPVELDYHDHEWGTPVHDDQKHFEFMILDGFQAGLSWITILRKREQFRAAFDNFDPEQVARYDDNKRHSLLQDKGIVRNRLKIEAATVNAQAFLAIQAEFGSFDCYIWQFVEGQTIHNQWQSLAEVPAKTPISDAMSKELKRRGFKFVGSTICYAYMQAAGLVNDHTVDCFRHAHLIQGRGQPQRHRMLKLYCLLSGFTQRVGCFAARVHRHRYPCRQLGQS